MVGNANPPADTRMLASAVRDLHFGDPGSFVTDVRAPILDLWEHNPWISRWH